MDKKDRPNCGFKQFWSPSCWTTGYWILDNHYFIRLWWPLNGILYIIKALTSDSFLSEISPLLIGLSPIYVIITGGVAILYVEPKHAPTPKRDRGHPVFDRSVYICLTAAANIKYQYESCCLSCMVTCFLSITICQTETMTNEIR